MKLKWPPRQPVKPLCCVTMVKDEEEMLTQWISHYQRHFSDVSFVVIDHASQNSVSKFVLGKWPKSDIEVIRLPDMPFDASFKAAALSAMAGTMLGAFQTVIVTDVDEIIIPLRPAINAADNLAALLDADTGNYIAPIGLEFFHERHIDNKFDFAASLTDQRSVVRLHAAYTKPAIWRASEASFEAGQHRMDKLYKVSNTLALAHLKFVDEEYALMRQTQRNSTNFAENHLDKGRGGVWKMNAHEKWSKIFDHVLERDKSAYFNDIYSAFRENILKPVNDKGVLTIKEVSSFVSYR